MLQILCVIDYFTIASSKCDQDYMISMSVAFHLLKMTHLAGSVWSCVSLVRGWWLCRPMGCDFNWIPAFSSRPQVKPVVLVLVFPDLGFFSSQPPPVHSSPLFHSLIYCAACAPGFPLLPWLPYTGPLICAVVWSCGRWVPSNHKIHLIWSSVLQIVYRVAIVHSYSLALCRLFRPSYVLFVVMLSFIFFQTGCVRLWGVWRARALPAYPVCNESDSTDTGKLILEVRL